MSNSAPVNLAFKIFDPIEKGTAPDVILLHGMSGNKAMFDKIGKNIADKSNRRVYALDMRNHGDSSWSDEFSWQIMAVDVSKFMDEHSIKSATLIGHSMGGIVSMIFGLTEPEKVDSIVVEDISPILPNQDIMNGIAGMILIIQNCLQSLPPDMDISDAIKHIAGEIAKHAPEEIKIPEENRDKFFSFYHTLCVKDGDQIKTKMNAEVLKKFLLDPKNHKDLEGLCQKPALFVYGSISTFKVMDDKDRILQLFPNAQFKALEGATHGGHMEFPEEFTEIVLPFLNN